MARQPLHLYRLLIGASVLLALLLSGMAQTHRAFATGDCDSSKDDYGLLVGCEDKGSGDALVGQGAVPTESIPSATPPSCLDAPDRDDCRRVEMCLPYENSDTGYAVWSGSPGISFVTSSCEPEEATQATPEVTEPLVRRAFERIELPTSQIVVQPPGGRTLVNFDTLFRTEAEPFTRTVRLLGRRVELEIWPASFAWQHGDGTSQSTTDPGRPYEEGVSMAEYVSHRYADAGVTVRPSVDTTYAARFRVDGGPWREVAGTVTRPGAGTALRVVEGRPKLVGGY